LHNFCQICVSLFRLGCLDNFKHFVFIEIIFRFIFISNNLEMSSILYGTGKMTAFCGIFLTKKGHFTFLNEIGRYIHEKNMILSRKYIFFMSQLHNFYVCPKIFINCTIFVKFVSQFSSRVANWLLWSWLIRSWVNCKGYTIYTRTMHIIYLDM